MALDNLSDNFKREMPKALDADYEKATIAERDALPGYIRFPGMQCVVLDKGDGRPGLYWLNANLGDDLTDNSYWELVGSGGVIGSGVDVIITPGYGLLYNPQVFSSGQPPIAPEGFRIPTAADWDFLIFNGGQANTVDKVRSIRLAPQVPGWLNTPGTDFSTLSFQGSGRRLSDGSYEGINVYAEFWEEISSSNGITRRFTDGDVNSTTQSYSFTGGGGQQAAAMIRCVSDEEPITRSVADGDGNLYTWVEINGKYWLQQSLRTTKLLDGTPIPFLPNNGDWSSNFGPAWCFPNGDDALPIWEVEDPLYIDLSAFTKVDGSRPFTGTQKGIAAVEGDDLPIKSQVLSGTPDRLQMPNADNSALVDSDVEDDGYDVILKRATVPIGDPDGYGLMYNRETANHPLLPPAGWRIPTDDELVAVTVKLGPKGLASPREEITTTGPINVTQDNHPAFPSGQGGTGLFNWDGVPNGYKSGSNGGYPNGNYYMGWWATSFAVRVFATNAFQNNTNLREGYSVRFVWDEVAGPEPPSRIITDFDGNEYGWIKLGGRIWLSRDYVCTTLRDGTPLLDATVPATWTAEATAGLIYSHGFNGATFTASASARPRISESGFVVTAIDEVDNGRLRLEEWGVFRDRLFEGLEVGVIDHGILLGLEDDDHPQYHTDLRADTWLGTRNTDDLAEGLTNLYNQVPDGGTTGQLLAKVDNSDYNFEWIDPSVGGIQDLQSVLDEGSVATINTQLSAITSDNINGFTYGFEGIGEGTILSGGAGFATLEMYANSFNAGSTLSLDLSVSQLNIYDAAGDQGQIILDMANHQMSSSISEGNDSVTLFGDMGANGTGHSIWMQTRGLSRGQAFRVNQTNSVFIFEDYNNSNDFSRKLHFDITNLTEQDLGFNRTVTWGDFDIDFFSNAVLGNVLTFDGTNAVWSAPTGGGGYTDEEAQDAIGTILSADFVYDDVTPAISLAASVLTSLGLADTALQSFTETDPVFTGSPAGGILSGDITNWDNAFGWGDHALVGYLTSFTETDPIFVASDAFGISAADISDWNDAHSWGDHALAGYLTISSISDAAYGPSWNGDTTTAASKNAIYDAIESLGSAGAVGGYSMIWAEENGNASSGSNGGYQYSFGNGATNADGATIGFDCTVVALTISAGANPSPAIVVELVINKIPTGDTITLSGAETNIVTVDVAVTAGDRITFKTNSGGGGSPIVVGAALRSGAVPDALVNDVTPQLGGNLDANGFDINMGTNFITDIKVGQWDDAFAWGDHALAGYLTSFTETDPVFSASPAATIILSDLLNWDNAFGWGDWALGVDKVFVDALNIDADTLDGLDSGDFVQEINGEVPTSGLVTLDVGDLSDVGGLTFTEARAQEAVFKEGTVFPVSPFNKQRFYRTDLAMEFYWDNRLDSGAGRWVSVDAFNIPFMRTGTFTNANTTLNWMAAQNIVLDGNMAITHMRFGNTDPAGACTVAIRRIGAVQQSIAVSGISQVEITDLAVAVDGTLNIIVSTTVSETVSTPQVILTCRYIAT